MWNQNIALVFPLLLQEELMSGEDIARCPSCSLRIRVVFDPEALEASYGGMEAAGSAEPIAAC